MPPERGVSSLAIDLTRLQRRTVTSFYSNLVTRPTGRAIRTGVESQITESNETRGLCLSVLDFSQVHVLDYSCADEIVAKLLLRFAADDRPVEAFFVVRGLQEHQCEAIEAVLERHGLLLVAEEEGQPPRLLGPSNPLERACWQALVALGSGTVREVAEHTSLAEESVTPALGRLVVQRVIVPFAGGRFCTLSHLTSTK